MSEFKLTQRIIDLSVASTWNEAKNEWGLETIWRAEESFDCLCGHSKIIEICRLINSRNQNSAIVGNCCVKKFLNIPSDLIFQAVARIQGDIERAINEETVWYAFKKGWINEWEKGFYMNTWRNRKLSGSQYEKRIQINRKVISGFIRAKN